MDATVPRPTSGTSPAAKWSVYAGVYAFLGSIALLLFLYPIADALITVLPLPELIRFEFLVVVPVPVIGAFVWWAVVERRARFTYLFGGTAGLLTALSNVVFWALVIAIVWGPLTVRGTWILVAFVLVVALPVAFVAGLPFMYARRHQ